MPLDYETLRIIWWLLIGILLIGFALWMDLTLVWQCGFPG